jgi:serine/threonine-protein kinase RsbT
MTEPVGLSARVIETLEAYASTINARAIWRRTLTGHGLNEQAIDEDVLKLVIPTLIRSMRLFVASGQTEELGRRLWAVVGPRVHAPRTVNVAEEADINRVRLLARTLCTDAMASSYVSQKVATAVSELARNILKYAGSGTVELAFADGPPRVIVVAADKGPGIKNLTEVLSGSYKSKTGMGLGLLGTRRLADSFHVDTGAGGTRVTLEVKL